MMKSCLQILLLFYWNFSFIIASDDDNSKTFETNFNHGFGEWQVANHSWVTNQWEDIKKKSNQSFQDPTTSNQSVSKGRLMVAVPNGFEVVATSRLSHLAFMSRDLNVTQNSNLELFFTCLIYNISRPGPLLKILYDDTMVFSLQDNHLESLSTQPQWNQFRLFSSYNQSATIKMTIMASLGSPHNLVALENIVVKTESNSSIRFGQEPEVDINDQNGTWEEVETVSEEKEDQATEMELSAESNVSVSSSSEIEGEKQEKPEFCRLAAEKGPCLGRWTRYFYNESADDCSVFLFGGCDGNENNFHSILACRVICQKPAEDPISRLIQSTPQHQEKTNLSLTFDDGFEDWQVEKWSIWHFNSSSSSSGSSSVGTTSPAAGSLVKAEAEKKPFNGSSKAAGTPLAHFTSSLNRPQLSHRLRLLPRATITVQFSLRCWPANHINPQSTSAVRTLFPFLHTLQPGFKVYIADILFFDYLLLDQKRLWQDDQWHSINVSKTTSEVLEALEARQLNQSQIQTVRIEAWSGAGPDNVLLLDDFHLTQVQQLPFPCGLGPSVSGPCQESLHRYFFDAETETCEAFVYGGCGGNANNFLTLQDCNDKCNPSINPQQRCNQPRNPGNCSDFTERFYFDSSLGRCQAFIFRGCQGNGNNFLTMNECENHCRHLLRGAQTQMSSVTTLPRLISDCQGKIDRGSCSSPIQMWAYDKKKGRCVPFTYGGCGGNLNRFFSRDQCQQTCEETSITTTTEKSVLTTSLKYVIKTKSACLRPRVGSSIKCGQGVKLSKFYFYNASSRKCQAEIGCPVPLDDTSRGNRFFSKISCLKLCSDTYNHDCRLSQDPGATCMHQQWHTRYSYDKVSNICRPFNYSGCEGNSNNFDSLYACQHTCKVALPHNSPARRQPNDLIEKCQMPRDHGKCHLGLKRYYYDPKLGKCLAFTYNGCLGNLNRFASLSGCENHCIYDLFGESKKGKSDVTAGIVIGIIVLGVVIIVGLLALKYYYIIRGNNENYRIFQNASNETSRTASISHLQSYENPTFQLENTTSTSSSA